MDNGNNPMEINPQRRYEPIRRSAPAQRSKVESTRDQLPPDTGDLFTGSQAQRLTDQLDGMPDVRDDWVEYGRQLLDDNGYPDSTQLREMALRIMRERDQSDPEGENS